MSCQKCLASHWTDWGLECRRQPPAVFDVHWTGANCKDEYTGEAVYKELNAATPAELLDKRNYRVVSLFPVMEPDDHCSMYIDAS